MLEVIRTDWYASVLLGDLTRITILIAEGQEVPAELPPSTIFYVTYGVPIVLASSGQEIRCNFFRRSSGHSIGHTFTPAQLRQQFTGSVLEDALSCVDSFTHKVIRFVNGDWAPFLAGAIVLAPPLAPA